MKIPPSKEPVTTPKPTPRNFNRPIRYPIPMAKYTAISGYFANTPPSHSIRCPIGSFHRRFMRISQWASPVKAKLSRGSPLRFLSALRSLESMPVASCDRANSAANFLVSLITQIGQGDSHRPFGGFEAAAVQQNDSVILGQAKCKIERVHILLEILNGVLAYVLACKKLEVNQTIVGVVMWVGGKLDAQTLDSRFGTPVHDLHACLLIKLCSIHHLRKRKQTHHDLLRQRQSRRVV